MEKQNVYVRSSGNPKWEPQMLIQSMWVVTGHPTPGGERWFLLREGKAKGL